ncbi:hypothetical protein A6U87_20690 [Rhizobium sp. AC44/96]|nr:hypothetical protein A6U87_20690 [Rhizobium sp. AC44/96]
MRDDHIRSQFAIVFCDWGAIAFDVLPVFKQFQYLPPRGFAGVRLTLERMIPIWNGHCIYHAKCPYRGIEAHAVKTGLLSGWGDQNRKTRPGNLAQGSVAVVKNELIVLC